MLLPTRIDINKAKANERKLEIDNGLSLARQIDSLRNTFLEEKKVHELWLKTSREEILKEIADLNTELESKTHEVANLEKTRIELIKPLNLEWSNVNAEKEKLVEAQHELSLDHERLNADILTLENEKKEVALIRKQTKQNEINTEKALKEADELRVSTQKEYRDASIFRENQESYYERKVKSAEEREKEYEVALKTIEIREQGVKDKEAELLERETLLKDRTAMLQREILRKQNGNH